MLLVDWLLERKLSKSVLACIVHHQLLVQMTIVHHGQTKVFPIKDRAVEGLTGSWTAGTLARIPIEDTLLRFKQDWLNCSFNTLRRGRCGLTIFTPSAGRACMPFRS